MNMPPAFYYFFPAAVLLLVYAPMTWTRVRAGVRPTRPTYLTWVFAAAIFVYAVVKGVLSLQQAA